MLTNTDYRKLDDGNGSSVDFTFPFPVIAATDLKVYKPTKATGALGTLMVLNVDYTVTLNTTTEGGTVHYAVAPTALQQSLIYRDMAYTQPDEIPTEGNYPEARIERMADRAVMLINQLKGALARALLLPVTSSLSNISVPAPEAGKAIVGNATEDGFENSSVDIETLADSVAAVDQAVTDAQAAQSGAVTAQGLAEDAKNAAEAAAASITFTKDNDPTMEADSDGVVPSQKAVRTYVAAEIPDYNSQAEAEAGTAETGIMPPLRVAQAIAALGGGKITSGHFSRDLSLVTGDLAITGLGFVPTTILIFGGCNGASSFAIATLKTGGDAICAYDREYNVTKTWGATEGNPIIYTAASAYQTLSLKSLDADGFTLTFTKSGSPSGTGYFGWTAFK